MQRTIQRLGGAVLALFMLAGCGKKEDPNKPPPGTLSDQELKSEQGAAKLIERAEVEAIYGFPFEEVVAGERPESYEKASVSTCIYTGKDANTNQSINILLQPIINATNAVESFEKTNEELVKSFAFGANVKLEPVEGIEEKAGWVEMMGALYVFKGKFFAIISATAPEGKTSKEIATALAKKVATRIP